MKNKNLNRDELILKISKSPLNTLDISELAQLTLTELEALHRELVNIEISKKTSGKPVTVKDCFFEGKKKFKPFVIDDEISSLGL